MATIVRRNGSFTALVRLKGFSPTAKTFADQKSAKGWATETEKLLRAQRQRGAVRHDVAALTVGALILEFLDDSETKALRYFDELHRMLAWWIQQEGTRKAIALNVLVLREARKRLQQGRAPATVNRYLSAMRSAWNWARSAGIVPRDHLWPERLMLTEPKGRSRFLSDDELARLLAAAKGSAQMHAAVVVAITTGIRQGELLRLDWADIDLDKQTLRVQLSKNNERRTVFLPTPAVTVLRALRGDKVRVIAGPVFRDDEGKRLKKTTHEGRWRMMRDKLGLADLRWHDLRHSCASFLAQNGATLMQIGAQLGHKSPSVTMRYSHLVEGAALPAHAVFDTKLKGL